ncbi:hypothetical protein F5Y16DRAFT_422209 [Xylariaceae sp. FL0255]|nr:hypothetical protein F5Y16DRAFT_422209 [Xylariaceae sp. FL0255]
MNTLPAKSVVECSLQAAADTHEIVTPSDNLLLISQQTDGGLVKVSLDANGQPTGAPTLQFENAILKITRKATILVPNRSQKTIWIPSPAFGPHDILVNRGSLWVACKDSSHVVSIIIIGNPSGYQVWVVSGCSIFIAVLSTSGDDYFGLDLSSTIWPHKSD